MNVKNLLLLALCSFGLSFLAPLVMGQDVVTTTDGARLTGEVLSVRDGVVKLRTTYAGELTIPTSAVADLSTGSEALVEFTDGTRARGALSGSGGTVSVGASNRPVSQVTALWRPGETPPDVAAVEAQRRRWAYEVDGRVAGNSGNTQAFDVGLGAKATLAGPTDTLRFYGSYQFGETDDSVSRDRARGGVDYQQDFYRGLLWYLRSEFGRDAVEDLDLYTEAAGGLGYKILDLERHKLTGRGGLAYRFESYGSGRNESFPGLDLGVTHLYQFDWVTLASSAALVMSLSDMSNWTLRQQTAADFAVLNSDTVSLRAGFENTYNNNPEPGKKKHDISYFSAVVLSFK